MAGRFLVLDLSLEMVALLRPVVEAIAKRDRDLASQIRRAASSVPMCLAEGSRRAGQDRTHLYRVAAGSADEVQIGLKVALAWGYVQRSSSEEVLARIDRILAMLWRITHPKSA